MAKRSMLSGASLVLLAFTATTLRAGPGELRTVEAATDTVHALSELPLRGIPQGLLREARGVAIIPGVVKAGFVVGGRFGRGVVLARQPDGCWGPPVFLTLAGGGVGLQAGVSSTDVVLVFQTAHSVDRLLRGQDKLTLGGDVAVAAGPVGRSAAAATDAQLRAEIYSYSRSRGLFAGVSLEGAALLIDAPANEAFARGMSPREVAAVEGLKAELTRLSLPPGPPAVIVVPNPPPVPLPPPPPPPPPPGR
jgi:lipid-binding SYLF domain-containing protein